MALIPRGGPRMAVQDRLRGGCLRLEDGPVGDVAIPLNQCRDGTAFADDNFEQFPDRIRDRPIVAVDQQQFALIIGLFRMPREMDISYLLEWKISQGVEVRTAVILRRPENVVDVEKKPASGPSR